VHIVLIVLIIVWEKYKTYYNIKIIKNYCPICWHGYKAIIKIYFGYNKDKNLDEKKNYTFIFFSIPKFASDDCLHWTQFKVLYKYKLFNSMHKKTFQVKFFF